MLKKCRICGKELHSKEFQPRRAICKKCRNEQNKKWKHSHIENVSKTNAGWRKRMSDIIAEGKSRGCVICGENNICSLDFHHIDLNEKEFCVSRYGQSFEKVKEEIKKCVVLCANCHRKAHSNIIDLEKYVEIHRN